LKILFSSPFFHSKAGDGDIYWVDAKVIEKMKPKELE